MERELFDECDKEQRQTQAKRQLKQGTKTVDDVENKVEGGDETKEEPQGDSEDDSDDELLRAPVFLKKKPRPEMEKEKTKEPTNETKNNDTERIQGNNGEQIAAANSEVLYERLVECVHKLVRKKRKVTTKDLIQQMETEFSNSPQLIDKMHQIIRDNGTSLVKSVTLELQPEERVIRAAVDTVFANADLHSCTVKRVVCDLEKQFNIFFNKETKAIIRNHLTKLVKDHERPKSAEKAVAINQNAVLERRPAPTKPETETSTEKARVPTRIIRNDDRATKSLDTVVCVPVAASEELVTRANLPTETSRPRRGRPARNHMDQSPTGNDTSTTRGTKRGRAKACALCKNCPCSVAADPDSISLNHLATSDAMVERALMKRLQKLEKTVEKYEDQTDDIRRKLKKHRKDMWHKMEDSREESSTEEEEAVCRFLPDSDELDRQLDANLASTCLGATAVDKATKTMFGQITLTQMMGVRSATDTIPDAEAEPAPEDQAEDQLESIAEDPVEEFEEDEVVADEETEDPIEDVASIPDDTSYCENIDQENESVAPKVYRVEIGDGTEITETSRIWEPSSVGGYRCPWDHIFADPSEADDLDLDHLQQLLEKIDDQRILAESEDEAEENIEFGMLSQRGQDIASDIFTRITANPAKLDVLKNLCPQWKENIVYALHQRDAKELSTALKSVRETKARLLQYKEALLRSMERQETCLDLFEESLQLSLKRFGMDPPPEVLHCVDVNRRMSDEMSRSSTLRPSLPFTPHTVVKPNGQGDSVNSDVKTLSPPRSDGTTLFSMASGRPIDGSALLTTDRLAVKGDIHTQENVTTEPAKENE